MTQGQGQSGVTADKTAATQPAIGRRAIVAAGLFSHGYLWAATASGIADAAPSVASLLPQYPAPHPSAPRHSDVVFSPRFDRPEAPAVARAFGATRIEWSYITKPESIAALRSAVGGGPFGGAINNNVVIPANAAAAHDFDGQPIIASWMKSWGAVWNGCSAPEGLQSLKDWSSRLMALGVGSIQMDGAGMQLESEYFGGGDFSPSSLKGFATWAGQARSQGLAKQLPPGAEADYRDWLRRNAGITSASEYMAKRGSLPSTTVWREYLMDGAASCLQDLRKHINTVSSGRVAFSGNAHTPYPWGAGAFLATLSDYVIGEVDEGHVDFERLAFFTAWLKSIGKRWVPVFPLTNQAKTRRCIAMAYACGANPVIPWDLWIPPSGTDTTPPARLFSTPADHGDLYRFVRDHAALFDGFETISKLDLIIYTAPPNTPAVLKQLRRLSDAQVSYRAVVRDRGSNATAGRKTNTGVSAFRLMSNTAFSEDRMPLAESLSTEQLTSYAAVSDAPPGVNVQVKAHVETSTKRVIHITRQHDADAGLDNVEFKLMPWALPAGKYWRVSVHRPGVASTSQTLTTNGGGRLALAIRPFAEWAIIEINSV